MSKVTKTVLNGAIDVVESGSNVAITATEEAAGLATATVRGVVNVGEKTVEETLAEARGLIAQGVASLRRVADAVSEPLP